MIAYPTLLGSSVFGWVFGMFERRNGAVKGRPRSYIVEDPDELGYYVVDVPATIPDEVNTVEDFLRMTYGDYRVKR